MSEDKMKATYSTAEVAEMFEVTGDTVRDWIQAEKLEALKINNRWRVTAQGIRDFAKRRHGVNI